ncbi:MAG: hypothetical protein FWG90_00165 [Oscillospiraceae bacterium]|nr:hypothetical protein [Oscillospiraceae bacterium]
MNIDQEAYTKWLYELDDDTFNNIRMQGHSHVNMGVSPSGVDTSHRAKILEQLEQDMFYVFMIWNKSLSIHTLIYDIKNNIMYDNSDIPVKLLYDDEMYSFLTDAKEKVKNVSEMPRVTKPKPANKKSESELEKAAKIMLAERLLLAGEEFDSDLAMYGYYPYSFLDDPYDLGDAAWLRLSKHLGVCIPLR